jgi:hypothetical protein
MPFADSMLRIDFKRTLLSHQRQVFTNPYTAVVEEYVVVGTKAQDVLWRVRPVVRGPERPDVRGLRVGTGEAFQPYPAHLASVIVQFFDSSCLLRVSNNA